MSSPLQAQDPVETLGRRRGRSVGFEPSMASSTSPGHVWYSPEFSVAQTAPSKWPADVTVGEARRGLSMPPPTSKEMKTSPGKRGLPPPPKAGEKVQPPEFYTLTAAMVPPSSPGSPRSSIAGLPNASPRMSRRDSYVPTAVRSRAPSVAPDVQPRNIEHPEGYIQDPCAAELTAAQRFAVEQEDQPDQGLPPPSTHSRKQSSASIGSVIEKVRRGTIDMVGGFQEMLFSEQF
ncbi:MAG: hypothetical protein Q9182_003675 [Xanthomendoza sp. 2 TL-2023]